jgi:dephospho-CoA kinase
VFADEAERDRLNALVHPAVKQAWREWLAAREGDSESAAVIVPLLYEAGAAEGWDAVVCVYASPDVQMARLRARGLTEAESRQRVAAQMPVAAKAELADYVVVNNGTRRLLEEQVERVLKSMCER